MFQTHLLRIRVPAWRQRSGSFSWVKHHGHRFHRPAGLHRMDRSGNSDPVRSDSLCFYRAEEFGHRYAEFIDTSIVWVVDPWIEGNATRGAERSAQAVFGCSVSACLLVWPVAERAMEAPAGLGWANNADWFIDIGSLTAAPVSEGHSSRISRTMPTTGACGLWCFIVGNLNGASKRHFRYQLLSTRRQ